LCGRESKVDAARNGGGSCLCRLRFCQLERVGDDGGRWRQFGGLIDRRDDGRRSGLSLCANDLLGAAVIAGRVVNVTLGDMGMTRLMSGTAPMGAHMMLRISAATVPAGRISLVASNMGWRTHEVVVLSLAAGAARGRRVPGVDGQVAETGSLGEASHSCGSGTGDGITSGTVSWVTVTLHPGRYELICNLPNHYVDGMYAQLVVS
jgi:uncharacterized cupredoxin-like copper-binding protein